MLCEEEIESVHRHDFVTCKCGNVSVDGGKDYLRRSEDPVKNYDSRTWVDTSKCEPVGEEDENE